MVKKLLLFALLLPSVVLAQPSGNPLPVDASRDSTFQSRVGSLTETAPATDTASSGLNGRLQRIAQHITTEITSIGTLLSQSDFDTKTGSLTETAPATDTASSGVNGRLQRVAQNLTTLNTTLGSVLTQSDFDTKVGSLTEAAPGTDTASSGLNGRLQRVAQRLTSLIAQVPAALTGSGNLKVSLQETNVTQPVSAVSLPLPSGAATETTLGTRLSESDFDAKTGSLTETAPATDTASSGLNGRLQRIAQRLTTIITGPIPASQSGAWDAFPVPRTTGGYTTFHLASAGTTNATNIKASAGQLYCWYIYNSNSSARKVALHNTAGTPTAGASVAISFVIPATSGANACVPGGIPFNVGIGITTVTGLADSDNTAVAANDLIINLWYF